jgi:isochorismate synthase
MSGVVSVRSRRLGAAFDLLALDPSAFVFERSGLGVAAVAGSVLPGDDVARLGATALALLRDRGWSSPEPPPFVVAGLPFRPGEPCEILLPRRWIRRTEPGETWFFDAGTEASLPPFGPALVAGRPPLDAFAGVQVRGRPSPDGYRRAVRAAVSRIRDGGLRKVVLARSLEVHAGRTLDPRRLAHRLRAVDPLAYSFVVPISAGDAQMIDPPDRLPTLVGASPELLVSRRGSDVRSNPLAGSAPRAGDPDEDRANAAALADSSKDREEHTIVVEAVAETLGPFCSELAWDPEPVLRETPNVWHLSTRFRGTLGDPAPSALDLVAALHPTPAVAGTPRDVALDTIAALEPFDRGRYAGPVGWMDANGDGEWAIALRCARLDDEDAILYAGAGIVAGSDPDAELDETERKFRAFLDALRWG